MPAGYTQSEAYSISDDGRISGWVGTVTNDRFATKWEGGQPIIAATLPGQTASYGFDINVSGTMVGSVYVGTAEYPARWTAAAITTLPTPSGLSARAVAVNSSGVAVGYTTLSTVLPLRWGADGSVVQLSMPSGYTSGRAYGINDAGDIVGVVYQPNATTAYKWNASGGGQTLGILTGLSIAYDIASTGIAAGQARSPQVAYSQAATFDRFGAATIFGAQGTAATNISDKGRLTILPHPYLPQTLRNGPTQTLPIPSPYTSGQAAGVNTCGTIVGNVFSTAFRAVRWQKAFCD